ncbi:MAG: CAP domain-containing protein [Leptospirales bacterium]
MHQLRRKIRNIMMVSGLIIFSGLMFAGCANNGMCADIDRSSGGSGSVSSVDATNDLTKSEATEILRQVNAVRSEGDCDCPASDGDSASSHDSLNTISWNTKLEKAASAHSIDMEFNDFFSHTGTGNTSVSDRVTLQAYAWVYVNENIAAGYSSVTEVMDGWLNSGGHCRNIMASTPNDIGVGLIYDNGAATYSSYWTMDMGKQ